MKCEKAQHQITEVAWKKNRWLPNDAC